MGKIRDIYGPFSAANLKARSSIPAVTDITVNASNIDCVNIKASAVKSVLSASNYSLYDLCRHTNVNRWSAWCPVIRTYSGTFPNEDIVNSVPTVCRLGDFAGYNHSALTPGWQSGGQASAQTDIWVDSGNQATVSAPICIGEIDWETEGAGWVVMLIYDEADGLVGWGKTDISTVANNFTLTGTTDVSGGIVLNKTWYARMFICAAGLLAAKEDVESASMCRIPNTTTFSVNIKVKAASTVYYSSTGTTQPPSPWVNNDGPLGMNWSTGYVTIGYDLQRNDSFTNVTFTATLRNWLGTTIGSGDIFNDVYYALDSVSGSAYLGMTSIPAFGYTVTVDIYETI